MTTMTPNPGGLTRPQHTNAAPLHARRLEKRYGDVRALDDVSVTIPPGQTVAIMGPSGSGKSTLLYALAGIFRPDAGDVSLGGDPVSLLNDARRSKLRRERFGFVFQDGHLLAELPARENVALPLLMRGDSRSSSLATADDWLGRLGLRGLGGRRPGEMSGGQAQRVAIARALIHSPAVVFADEPTGALDQATGRDVMHVLTAATRAVGATLVLVTHDPGVAGWCERLLRLSDGKVVADEPTGDRR